MWSGVAVRDGIGWAGLGPSSPGGPGEGGFGRVGYGLGGPGSVSSVKVCIGMPRRSRRG